MEPMLEKMVQIFNKSDDAKSNKSQGDDKVSKTVDKYNKTDVKTSKTDVKDSKSECKVNKSNAKGSRTKAEKSQADDDTAAKVLLISSDRSSRQSSPLILGDPGKSLNEYWCLFCDSLLVGHLIR